MCNRRVIASVAVVRARKREMHSAREFRQELMERQGGAGEVRSGQDRVTGSKGAGWHANGSAVSPR